MSYVQNRTVFAEWLILSFGREQTGRLFRTSV